jgi:hypothetical protein
MMVPPWELAEPGSKGVVGSIDVSCPGGGSDRGWDEQLILRMVSV